MLALKRKPFILLEILIAFVITLVALLPMIEPYLMMLKEEKAFLFEIEGDRLAKLTFLHIVQKLTENQISWEELLQCGKTYDIDFKEIADFAAPKGFPYKGSYSFQLRKAKPPKSPQYLLISVMITFKPIDQGKELSFNYELFVQKEDDKTNVQNHQNNPLSPSIKQGKGKSHVPKP